MISLTFLKSHQALEGSYSRSMLVEDNVGKKSYSSLMRKNGRPSISPPAPKLSKWEKKKGVY